MTKNRVNITFYLSNIKYNVVFFLWLLTPSRYLNLAIVSRGLTRT